MQKKCLTCQFGTMHTVKNGNQLLLAGLMGPWNETNRQYQAVKQKQSAVPVCDTCFPLDPNIHIATISGRV